MDPFSVGGLALGVVSLTFQVFSGCVTAYQLLLDANDMPERYQFLWVRLQMEQNKLLDWGRIANVSETEETLSPGLRLSRHSINDLLHQIESLLLDLGGLQSKYKLKLVVDEKASSAARQAKPAQSSLMPDAQDALKRKALELMGKARRYPSRLCWAAFDKGKFEGLLADLTTLTDSMMYFLEGQQKQRLLELQQNSFMHILQLSNKMDELYSLVSSLEATSHAARNRASVSGLLGDSARESSDQKSRSVKMGMDDRLMRLAKFKAASVAVEQNIPNSTGSSDSGHIEVHSSLELSMEMLTIGDHGASGATAVRSWCVYNGVDVWVEWKHYVPIGLDFDAPPYVSERVRKLAKLLQNGNKPEEFRVPDCLGYVHQPEFERYGYVFRWPATETLSELSFKEPPVSLQTLLQTTQCPPLNARIAMMRIIATSIWYLHATNWLHKGLRSENVVFPQSAASPVLISPFISGFEYSRPADTGEQTEKPAENLEQDLYRHPKAQFDYPREGTRGFRKIYDIYSLGIVMLEVALWQSVRAILRIPMDRAVTPKDAKMAWNVLAEQKPYIGTLCAMTGESVSSAVTTCIVGDFGLSDGATEEENNVTLQAALGEKVVKVLDGISV